jgi:hypothetical protein
MATACGKKHVRYVVEKRHASKHDQRMDRTKLKSLQPGHRHQRWTNRHQQKIERRRILRHIEKREQREKGRPLVTPWRRITIEIAAVSAIPKRTGKRRR